MTRKKPWIKPELTKLNFPHTESGKMFNEQEQPLQCHVTSGGESNPSESMVGTGKVFYAGGMRCYTLSNESTGTFSDGDQYGPS